MTILLRLYMLHYHDKYKKQCEIYIDDKFIFERQHLYIGITEKWANFRRSMRNLNYLVGQNCNYFVKCF